jgi:hypothetical protein
MIKGLHNVSIQSIIKALFETPSIHFAVEERQYGERIVASLNELLRATNGISPLLVLLMSLSRWKPQVCASMEW